MKEKGKQKVNFKIILITMLIVLFIITSALSIVYYIKVTPKQGEINDTVDFVNTKRYYNSKKDIPSEVNVNEDILNARVYFDFPTDVELKNKIIKNKSELSKYITECAKDSKVSFYNTDIEKNDVLEYFTDEFFNQKNLLVIAEKMTDYTQAIQSITKDGNNLNISIKQVYDVSKFIIPIGFEFIFVTLNKDISNVNIDIYRNTRVYVDTNLQIAIASLTILLIILIIVLAIVLIEKPKAKSEEKYNKVLSIFIGIIISIVLLALIFGGIILYSHLFDYFTLVN